LYFHIVWATKKRFPFIPQSFRKELFSVISSLVIKSDLLLLAIGGIHDHVHILVRLKKWDDIPKLMRKIKSVSSGFMNKKKEVDYFFAWQEGYSIFSVSASALDDVARYINNQEEHHKTFMFEDEIKFFLNL
jgi:REP element-mobilizing transposase RayT